MDRALADKIGELGVRNASLRVEAPELGFSGAWAHGEAAPGVPMTVETPFLSASVGKLFTAATVIALAERGVLSLDAPMARWLPSAMMVGLPVKGGDAAARQITLRMLLGHRSGLPDYFEGTPRTDAPKLRTLLLEQPDRRWSREELLAYTKENFSGVGAPGEVFTYADTNYDLLGAVIEGATDLPWHRAVRRETIVPIGLDSTWYHDFESRPDGVLPVASAWSGEAQVTGTAALSSDQAGGGLVTTAQDLVRFMRAIEQGHPVGRSAFEPYTSDAIVRGVDYGLGMWRIRPFRLTWGLARVPDLYGASGVTGSFAYVVPAYGATIVGTFNQSEIAKISVRFVVAQVLATLSRIERPEASA